MCVRLDSAHLLSSKVVTLAKPSRTASCCGGPSSSSCCARATTTTRCAALDGVVSGLVSDEAQEEKHSSSVRARTHLHTEARRPCQGVDEPLQRAQNRVAGEPKLRQHGHAQRAAPTVRELGTVPTALAWGVGARACDRERASQCAIQHTCDATRRPCAGTHMHDASTSTNCTPARARALSGISTRLMCALRWRSRVGNT